MESPRAAPLVIARGGNTDTAPGHTIAALESALEVGADALALGIHLSRDGHPVVFGATKLERISDGRGPLGALTVRELKRLDAGGWKGPRFLGQRIQTLQEVLERFRDRTRFWLELSGSAALYPEIEERVIGTLEIYDAIGVSVVVVQTRLGLASVRAWSAETRLATVWAKGPLEKALPESGLAEALWAEGKLVTEAAITRIRGAGLQCHAWIDDEPALVDRLVTHGVDGLITGRPGALVARLGRR
jgi:glycerophosphoryl diester phosphodiesterase